MSTTRFVLAGLALALPGLSSAQTTADGQVNGQVKFALTQDLIKPDSQNGHSLERVITSPKVVTPGDILREQVTLQNVSGKTLRNVQVSVPLPSGTTFTGTVSTDPRRWKLMFSADKGLTYAETPRQAVTVTENGKTVSRKVAAPASAYTNVRWVVHTLKANESLKLNFRVKVR